MGVTGDDHQYGVLVLVVMCLIEGRKEGRWIALF